MSVDVHNKFGQLNGLVGTINCQKSMKLVYILFSMAAPGRLFILEIGVFDSDDGFHQIPHGLHSGNGH